MAASSRTYLDYNATSPLKPEVKAAFVRALDITGNPSSVHSEGRSARGEIEKAREQVAALVGGLPRNVVFTSGGTEANNLVLNPVFGRPGAGPGLKLLVGSTEHPSVLQGHRFAPDSVILIPVDREGVIDLNWLRANVSGETLVSIQVANSETGALQPLREAADIVHAAGGLIHADAVQAAGKVPLNMTELGIDALTLSAHKIGGPKGIGALVLGSEGLELGERLLRGGGQERRRRAGTENVPAIVAFGAAAALAVSDLLQERVRLSALRDEAEATVRRLAPDAVVFCTGTERLPNTLAFAIPGLKAETALIGFDLAGIALSSGSACSSGKVKRSHVLDAMGIAPDLAEGALRVSLGWSTTREDVFRFAEACEKVLGNLYKRRASAA
jgi:cysteine desulfurase